jgi:azurin/glucose/arabinose dehydrogenase
MPNYRFYLLGLSAAIFALHSPANAAEALLQLKKGDHVAIVGGGLADRQQHQGWLEAMIHRANPDLDLTIRNLGFSADEINVHPRSAEVPTTEFFLSMKKGDTALAGHPEVIYKAGTDFGADVILAYWGFNESFHGPEGLDAFKQNLDAYLKTQLAAEYNGESAPRLVLFSPIANENLKSPDYPDGSANNANLDLYTKAMAEVAHANSIPFIDLFHPSQDLYSKSPKPLTINGIHLTDEGDQKLAPIEFKALFGKDPAPVTDPAVAKIRDAVLEKNEQWHHRYRTVDQYNIYGGRSRISYAGTTNATILNEEMAQRDVKTANRDQLVWATAKGKAFEVKDDNLPPVALTPPNRTDTTPYLSAEESIKHLKLPENCKVELVASEETFPELVNPVQMNFDTKGRLWIAAWPSYPETTPTTKVFDKLLVVDLDPKTGKATKITTFADGLNCPTGFQFYKDGVIVMQSPDLWFLRDTDGDGKADTKERVLHGLDAADSHHETNSICLEPGGAMYLNDGIFHCSNVETYNGPVRNTDGTIYRFEPGTSKFMRHAPFGFANPHGRVFDYWGNDLLTDATGNDNYFGPALSGYLDSGKHPKMEVFWDRPARPTPGTAILSSRHFPDEWQGDFLNTNVISIQGIFRAKLTEEGSGIKGETLENLITDDIAANPNFRPSGITVAPDGSLYFMDWSQMLIGHLQHHLRDPNRDHQHGRLYRITYEGRPLLVPKKVDGEPIPALLELLKEPEDNVRQRAKIELGKHNAKEVTDAATAWVKTLDPKDPKYEHNVLEALWVHQWHNVVNVDLLKKVFQSPDPRARAQAVRVLGYWRDRVPNAIDIVKLAANDEAPRVRLEAVRVASFFRQWEAADAALTALTRPADYYISYCLKETMRQLKPWWKDAISEGKPIAVNNPAGINFMLESVSTGDLANLPKSAPVFIALLTRDDAPAAKRTEALTELAKLNQTSPAATLLTVIKSVMNQGGKALDLLNPMLLQQPAADLKAVRADLAKLTESKVPFSVRRTAFTAAIIADGSINATWQDAAKSPEALVDWLKAIPAVPDATLRATAYEKTKLLLTTFPAAIQVALKNASGVNGRYVRVGLPHKGTLSLAEVEVISGGKNIATSGKATQSSTSNGGTAEKAIDGKTSGNFGSGSITHSDEGDRSPWWEVDLGKSVPIEAVTVWNRSESNGQYAARLEGFDVVVLDQDHNEILKKGGNPAPAESATISVADDGAGTIRRAAIDAMISTGKEPAAVFTSLAGLIKSNDQTEAAAIAIGRLPRAAWSKAEASGTTAALVAWAGKVSAAQRSGPEFVETVKVGNELAGLLPADQTTAARKALGSLGVRIIEVHTVKEALKFDVTRIVVEAGKPFEVAFTNPDGMPHNIVFVQPGTHQAVAESVQANPPNKLDSEGRAYVPENDKRVIGASKLVEAGKSTSVQVTAPDKEGTYEFVCTFPGHWPVMKGQLIVTKDVDAYEKANPLK